MKIHKMINNIKVLFFIVAIVVSFTGVQAAEKVVLKVVWNASSADRLLKTRTLEDLSGMSMVSSRERDPASGQMVEWKGVLISKWIEKELAELPLDQRSQVDLLILKNTQGQQAIIPRYVVKSYPLMLAWEKDQKKLLESNEAFTVVVPWSSGSKITQTHYPWTAYQISGVREIQLSSYQSRFSSLLLKRRTDPAAVRGEKMVVENCLSCHGNGRARGFHDYAAKLSELPQQVSSAHARSEGPELKGRDLRAFMSYLAEYRTEKSTEQSP